MARRVSSETAAECSPASSSIPSTDERVESQSKTIVSKGGSWSEIKGARSLKFDGADFLDRVEAAELVHELVRGGAVEGEESQGEGGLTGLGGSKLETRDVHSGLTQMSAEQPHHAGAVVVACHEEVTCGVEVEVQRVDTERERISLDLRRGVAVNWSASAASYEVGEEFTGWVSRTSAEGVHVSLEEGVEGIIPRETVLNLKDVPIKGDIIRTRIAGIDPEKKLIELKPIE